MKIIADNKNNNRFLTVESLITPTLLFHPFLTDSILKIFMLSFKQSLLNLKSPPPINNNKLKQHKHIKTTKEV